VVEVDRAAIGLLQKSTSILPAKSGTNRRFNGVNLSLIA
jgi:hypothetical protein